MRPTLDHTEQNGMAELLLQAASAVLLSKLAASGRTSAVSVTAAGRNSGRNNKAPAVLKKTWAFAI
jgi:hypothetical protein